MKLLNSIHAALLVGAFLMAPNAYSGVLHPCPEGSLIVEKMAPVEVLSKDGGLVAILQLEKVVNNNCINVINDYLYANIDVVKVEDGQTIFPTFLEVLTQIVNENGNLIEQLKAQAPASSLGIRLLKGTSSVNILIEGFETIAIQL